MLWNPGLSWARYLELLDGLRTGSPIPEGLVHSDFLLAEVEGEVVGRVSIRYVLNEALAEKGGHVGYGVRPAFRRRGFATEILRQSLGRLRHGAESAPSSSCATTTTWRRPLSSNAAAASSSQS